MSGRCPDCSHYRGSNFRDGKDVRCVTCAGTGRISDALARKLKMMSESSSKRLTPRIHAMQELGKQFMTSEKDIARLPAPSELDITFMRIADKHGIDISMPWDEDYSDGDYR